MLLALQLLNLLDHGGVPPTPSSSIESPGGGESGAGRAAVRSRVPFSFSVEIRAEAVRSIEVSAIAATVSTSPSARSVESSASVVASVEVTTDTIEDS